ncbi:MAG TPA: Nif3-like dinuclear metal center hexameric protein [Bryobacteraceae bacterium]|nr:Nif3-like dinuclear metal center hexameric protein [Bryobacteraceae bacterium]
MHPIDIDKSISRRGFARWATTALAASPALAAADPLTAAQIVDRIKKKLAEEGVVWGPSNFDRFHLGDPGIQVVGVATTFQPTLRVLQRALAAGKNFVVAHESTWWDGFDPVEAFLQDSVCQAKIRFAEQNHMAVWRIHDHWHRRKPDPIFTGLARKLEWSAYYKYEERPRHYEIPEMSLEEVARHIQQKLGTQNVVVVGDRNLRVKTVGDCAHILSSVLPALRACDVALVGETPQHDTFEYLRDAMSLGMKKGVVMISHEGLEEWGMQACADWLKPVVPELPVEWIATGDPFQVPAIRV